MMRIRRTTTTQFLQAFDPKVLVDNCGADIFVIVAPDSGRTQLGRKLAATAARHGLRVMWDDQYRGWLVQYAKK